MKQLKFSNWQIKYKEWNKNNDTSSQEDRIKAWVTQGIDQEAIEWAEKFATYLAKEKEKALDQDGKVIKIKVKVKEKDKEKELDKEKDKEKELDKELDKEKDKELDKELDKEKDKELDKEKDKELEPLTSSQLRKFFGAIKSLQNQILMESSLEEESELPLQYKKELLMLKPKLAYAVARAKSDYAKIHNFYNVVDTCIDHVKTKQNFKNFISLLEAIVAYHKVEEEKKS